MRVRITSWIFAVVCFLAFAWLGLAAVRFRPIYEGLQQDFHLAEKHKLFLAYGPVACPILGLIVATAVILSDTLFSKKWILAAVIAAAVVLFIAVCRACLFVALCVERAA
jgi:hypothetical protein